MLRYQARVQLASGLPAFAEADELARTCGITLEEAACASLIGLPVTYDYNDAHAVGTVVASTLHRATAAWTATIVLRLPPGSGSVAQFETMFLAPVVKIVRGSPHRPVKAISSLSIARSTILPGAAPIAALEPLPATFSAVEL